MFEQFRFRNKLFYVYFSLPRALPFFRTSESPDLHCFPFPEEFTFYAKQTDQKHISSWESLDFSFVFEG